jgi:hypothetical protein
VSILLYCRCADIIYGEKNARRQCTELPLRVTEFRYRSHIYNISKKLITFDRSTFQVTEILQEVESVTCALTYVYQIMDILHKIIEHCKQIQLSLLITPAKSDWKLLKIIHWSDVEEQVFGNFESVFYLCNYVVHWVRYKKQMANVYLRI